MRRQFHIALVLAALAGCGGVDAVGMGNAVHNPAAAALSGQSVSAHHSLWACMTFDPAGSTSSASTKATIGCGAILPRTVSASGQ